MINFKKSLQENAIAINKKKREADAHMILTGAIQTLLNLDPKVPFVTPEQSEMLVCQCCGHTWECSEAETVRKSWARHEKTVRGPLCDICWHLWSVANQAHVRKLSLKDVVFRFLRGRAKQLHRDFEAIWTEKA